MATKVKEQSVSIAKAVARVLGQQASPHWDGKAHLAMLGYLAEDLGLAPEKRKEFVKTMFDAESECAYASNFKKWLVALKEVPSTETKANEYE